MATALALRDALPSNSLRRAQAVEHGLPIKMLRALLKDGEITLADLSRVIAPRRTLERRIKENDRLTVDESDRLARFMTILELCEHIFGDRHEAMDWLRSPMLAFQERAGLDLLRTAAGGEAVNNLLQRGRHGMLA